MFENIKSGEIDKKLVQHSFRIFIKLLDVSIVLNDYNKIKSNSKGVGGLDTDEEEKVYIVRNQIDKSNLRGALFGKHSDPYEGVSRWRTSSDPSSTECGKSGNRYKNSIFVKIRGLSFSCISLICQLNIHKSFLSDLFEDDKFKESKNQDAIKGKDLPNLSPKSLVKLPNLESLKEENFGSDYSDDDVKCHKEINFFKQMHELFCKLLSNESYIQNQLNIMKTFWAIIPKWPYSKIPFGLVSKTVLPFVNKNFIHKNKNQNKIEIKTSTRNNNQSKYHLQVVHLVKALLAVRELKSELKKSFWGFESDRSSIVFENLLDYNETNIETLAMVGKNYPDIFWTNWRTLKCFLEEVLEIDNPKLHIGWLKLIEEWLNNFNKDYVQRDSVIAQKSESDENITKVSSSSSSFLNKSDEEDKSSWDSHDFESATGHSKSRYSDYKEVLHTISPFYLDDFGAFLNKVFLKFLKGSDDTCKNIILNILSFFKEENWEIFKDEDFDWILKVVNAAKDIQSLKQAWIKFLGYIIYHKRFHQNQELIHDIIERLYGYGNETNQQIWQKNSWAIANICCSWDLNTIDNILTSKLLWISFMYAESTKEKIISNSIRALGYILSRCSESTLHEIFEIIQTDEIVIQSLESMWKAQGIKNMKNSMTIESVIEILLGRIQDSSPKISWNAWVSLGNILEQSHIRRFDVGILFSKKWIDLLMNIIKEKPNYCQIQIWN